MAIAYVALLLAFVAWPLTVRNRLKDVWAWFGNAPGMPDLRQTTHADVEDVTLKIISPMLVWAGLFVIALLFIRVPSVGVCTLAVGHVVVAFWLFVPHERDYSWLRLQIRPQTSLQSLVWLHDRVART